MFDEINNTPEELLQMENQLYDVIDWSKDRMHELVEADEVDDATAIYFEFSEWYDPNGEFSVVIIDEEFRKLFKPLGHRTQLPKLLDILPDGAGNIATDCPVCKGEKSLWIVGRGQPIDLTKQVGGDM